MDIKSKKTNGGAYSDAPLFSKAVVDQAVKFVAKLSRLTREVNEKLTTAIKAILGWSFSCIYSRIQREL